MIYQILEQLASNNSRKFKEQLLEQHQHNQVLKEVVRLALCAHTQFYIRKIPSYAPANHSKTTLESVLPLLSNHVERRVSGHDAVDHLTSMLESLTKNDALVLERIIQKDLRCGVSIATANKIWPGLIRKYPVMLASKQDSKLLAKIEWPACAQIKMDGMRANIVVRNGKTTVYSRSGKVVELHGVFDEDSANVPDCVIDGELVVLREDNAVEDRKTGNGILNKAVKGTISESEAKRVVMVAWDLIPYAAFVAEKDATPYKKRLANLEQLIRDKRRVRLVPNSVEVANLDEAEAVFKSLYNKGEEGIILKAWNSPWENKRSNQHIKFKGQLQCELRVVGWQPGTGKHTGRLGALICESECGQVQVNVGSGFSDQQREEFTPNTVIGQVVTVEYNAVINDKSNGQHSLFLPVFVELRLDKDQADSFDQLANKENASEHT